MGMSEEEAWYEQAREDYANEIAEQTLAGIKESAISCYFYYYGDGIEERIRGRIDAAKALLKNGFNGESLTNSIIAIELTIRWFLLRPLCNAAFMAEEVADILVEKILPKKSTGVDREIFPKILKEWDSDVDSLELTDGGRLWDKLTKEYFPIRNAFIHRGEVVEKTAASGAIDAADRLLAEAIRIVTQFKKRGKDGWGPQHVRRKLEDL